MSRNIGENSCNPSKVLLDQPTNELINARGWNFFILA